ncbi:MAG TPA: cytochrome c [Gammaproteobacteria bacterium]
MDTFLTHCASCHGIFGEGDGPVAATIAVPAPNLRTLSERNGGVFPEEAVSSYIDGRDMPVVHGDRIMPVWGPIFDATSRIVVGADDSNARIAAVVGYLRELQY